MALRSNRATVLLVVLLFVACKGEESATEVFATPPEPIHVTVIADGFTLGVVDKKKLADFVTGTLEPINEVDPFDLLKPAPVFKFDTPQRLNATVSGKSVLGLIPTQDRAACYFKFEVDKDTFLDRLAVETGTPPKTEITIVVMRVPDGMAVGACAIGPNLVLTSHQMGTFAIAHEFGHSLAGLKDEAGSSGAFTSSQPYSRPNCSASSSAPGWKVFKQTNDTDTQSPLEGCAGYAMGLFRPTDACRMITTGTDFCCVCREHMLRQLSDRLQVDLPRPDERRCEVDAKAQAIQDTITASGAYVTADFYGANGDLRSVKGGVGDARNRLVAGDYFASVALGGKVLAARSLPDDPGFARAYPPVPNAIDERVPAPLPTRLTIFVPASADSKYQTFPLKLEGKAGIALLNTSFRQELTAQLPP
jgi:hypothetical protein